jgi:hypothetical protein
MSWGTHRIARGAHEYPFLEGWGPAGSAPIALSDDRAAVHVPTVDDETVFRVLERLLVFEGQRLSYRVLDVEQIGCVYEALMGYHVLQVPAEAVCVKPDRIWVTAEEVLEVPAPRRGKWLKETLGLSAAQAEKLNVELEAAQTDRTKALEALSKFAAGGKKADPSLSKARPGQLVLQPGSERRILSLKVCDPAMGSGAFLVEACRFLADHVLAAWTRENKTDAMADPLLHARRLVAQRCLYGVDKNDAAVELAKLSLWLVTLAKDLPFTFLDHALRHGDSLVGLDFDQIRAFHWKKPGDSKGAPKQLDLFGREIAMALEEAIELRQKIGDLGDSPVEDKEKARLFWDAQDALDRVRLIGDLVVGAFFAHEKDKDREAELTKRENLVRAWLLSDAAPTEELLAMQQEMRARLPLFHWMVEFPEVFYAERPDPLDDGRVNRAAYMDAVFGNPPFLGQKFISATFGDTYRDWLFELHEGTFGKADLCAQFFRRADRLLGYNGAMGFISTNTIGQGDTREGGLAILLAHGYSLYEATTDLVWPGNAAVVVASTHLCKGSPVGTTGFVLNGRSVEVINSYLRAEPERQALQSLQANALLTFKGVDTGGAGFLLEEREYRRLMENDERNALCLARYVGGEEVNTSPRQNCHRFTIDFGDRPLAEAERWVELLEIVRQRVLPHRMTARDNNYGRRRRQYWWQFGERQPALFQALSKMDRCLVTAIVTKHLCFSALPSDRVFASSLYVFLFDSHTGFSVLQSRAHELWVRRVSSSLEDRLRYAASDCFETFPFPKPDPRTSIPALEDIGQRLYDFRAKYMVDDNVGLTITYNRLKDPACNDTRILELRQLHEEMDRKVLEAYAEGDPEGRWLEVEVPPFCPMTEEDKKELERFDDAVIDRLFVLNAKRAEEEKIKGLGGKGAKGKRGGKGKGEKGQRDLTPARFGVFTMSPSPSMGRGKL